jgi:predicted AAA+ superfamily ATPase
MTNDDARASWFSGYVQTYLERDLQALKAVENLADFRRLMRAACLRIGRMLNQTELGRDVSISQPQVHRFMNLMETSFQAIRLPAYSVNRTKRLIKAPKLDWCDTALALHLAGESEPRREHLENLVLTDLLAWRDTQARRPEVLYWRTVSGEEVDFVIETPSRTVPIEVKAATRVSPSDAPGPQRVSGGVCQFLRRWPLTLRRYGNLSTDNTSVSSSVVAHLLRAIPGECRPRDSNVDLNVIVGW